MAALLGSVAAIAAPGSRVLLDFLHTDAVDGSAAYPGYAACAEVGAHPTGTFHCTLEHSSNSQSARQRPCLFS